MNVTSLRGRISVWLALQSFVALTIVCSGIYATLHWILQSRQVELLAQKQVQLLHLVAEVKRDTDVPALKHKLRDFLVGYRALGLSLRRDDGSVFYEADVKPDASGHVRRLRFEISAPTAQIGALTATLGIDTTGDDVVLHRFAVSLVCAAVLGAMLISSGAFFLVRSGLGPVRNLVIEAQRLRPGNLQERLTASAQPQELVPLVAQFNALLARLQEGYERLDAFNADVAHELCTPLTTLMGTAELALSKGRSSSELREVLGSNLEELQRIASIVQDMLFLARADRGEIADRSIAADLADVVRVVAEYHEAAFIEAGIAVRIVGDAKASIDPALVQRALSNLLANAARYATPGTVVEVALSTISDGAVSIAVANKGQAIAPHVLPRLFDRFFRYDPSSPGASPGHGLGLSIVAAVARMHGGQPFARSTAGVTQVGFTVSPRSLSQGGPQCG